ncbi:bifunctional [glutamine synthetase] adenylyltransferase/[glutamine synthetase]-adenylyl-L-tyrosine phosphorylase [Microlunatus elymi]|uniref:Bifunctional glutamine synthetase adenylyltransferase/adenylyl-removing enzyme n=1 Tax=Microlunatus elymi TaxID=2596828 RepID=A0A516Q2V8_9ACTN|nr:bifunctional [glutamine synthetase] adenylyltransferase/[glutamine synthetase]-adenylyl-L-tyrosine phosphorylase [Microlunatus elymi]QDP97722.1 bifunctional [glutamine synthetase] adenylyltransferase/[glutamine synthetase]-adenylyl-L-tyrosine phosphorylase [Microlunatus elymi]
METLQITQGALARRGFTDSATAAARLAGWGNEHLPLLELVSDSADPDHGLLGLDRLADELPGLLDRLLIEPELARRLILVLGGSSALQQHLLAHPQHLDRLTGDGTRTPADQLRAEMLAAVGARPEDQIPVASEPPIDQLGDRLRIGYRGALLRIAARDLVAPEPIELMPQIAAELSDLADATLEAGLALARRVIGPERAARCRLAVIGLGKCGAQELNYVSDVDVLYVAEPADESVGIDEAITIATQLAAELSRICSAHTAAGTIWELDAGLRPEGKAGPLVRTLASHRGYYQKWAKTWEFQAMLKARPVAGDRDLGTEFVQMITPMVWEVAERDHFIADARAMRMRVIEHIPQNIADRELKLGPGGLRDVEFSVQLLQLVHGRADVRLRSASTLEALQALIDYGYVGREDGKGFGLAYQFLRSLEHRIQLNRLRRTHVLPTAEDDLRRIGRSLHYSSPVDGLLSTWRSTANRVRMLHRRLFYSPVLDAVASISSAEVRLTTEAAQDRLQGLGYEDPKAALRHIEALSNGVSRRAEIQRQLLPAMLGWFADGPNPDHGLLAFRQTSDALGTTPWYLRALRDESAMAERFARILASSRYAVSLLQRAPQSVQMLADDHELIPRNFEKLRAEMSAAAGRQNSPTAAVEAIRAIRRRELFRIAAGDLLGLSDVLQIGEALTDLASATVHTALAVVREAAGADPESTISVIAMGRWGGRELSYGSDADAMFVLSDRAESDRAESDRSDDQAKVAPAVITELRRLLSLPGADPALVIDTDLRPEGKGGPLIRTLAAYRTYYQRWSSTWEMQALIRAEPLAGDLELGRELVDVIDPLRWPADGLTATQVTEIRRLKARMEAERLPRGTDPSKHLKLGPGGLTDVEWTVQLLQLQHAGTVPELRTSRTIEALEVAARHGLIGDQQARWLRQAWLMASRIRNQIMLVRGRSSDTFPTDPRELSAVAQLMGRSGGEGSHLVAEYQRIARRARRVTDAVFWQES